MSKSHSVLIVGMMFQYPKKDWRVVDSASFHGLGSNAFAECVRVREPLVNLFQDCFGGAFERKIPLRGDRSRFEVDFDRSRAGCFRGVAQRCSRMDPRRRSDRQENIARDRNEGSLEDLGIDSFAEPHDAGSEKATAVGAVGRHLWEGNNFVEPAIRSILASAPAPNLPDGSMEANDVTGTGALMQAVDVLGDQGEVIESAAPARKNFVGLVRLTTRDELTPPLIPLPDKVRVFSKGFGCGETFGTIGLPEPFLTSERRHAARGRHARTG